MSIELPPVQLCHPPADFAGAWPEDWILPSHGDFDKTGRLVACGVVELDHPAYQHPAEEVTSDPTSDSEVQAIARQLRVVSRNLQAAGYVVGGLAAPQVGESARMVLVGDTVMINPTFSPTLARFAGGLGQGCFSMTGPLGSPVRPHFGRVNWLDLQGNEVSKRVVPDVSHRVQHEIDHLDGETFVDRLFDAGQPVRYAHAEHYGLYLANQQKGRRAEPWPKEYYYSSAQWRQVKSGALVTSKFVVR